MTPVLAGDSENGCKECYSEAKIGSDGRRLGRNPDVIGVGSVEHYPTGVYALPRHLRTRNRELAYQEARWLLTTDIVRHVKTCSSQGATKPSAPGKCSCRSWQVRVGLRPSLP